MTKEALENAVKAMQEGALYDVTIVCTTDDHQAAYWMEQLAAGVCQSSGGSGGPYPMVLAVSEDWGGSGAGNGLGTLYAYQKAVALAQSKYGVDLAKALDAKEISVALYHTAGKGTRMAPLPASENNNKPGVVSTLLLAPCVSPRLACRVGPFLSRLWLVLVFILRANDRNSRLA